MNSVKAFGFLHREVNAPHGTNLESGILDTLENSAGDVPLESVRLDNRQRSL
jgi:hypothetical protein